MTLLGELEEYTKEFYQEINPRSNGKLIQKNFRSLEKVVNIFSKGTRTAVENIKRRKYLKPSNYVSDIVAANLARSPAYIFIDNVILGVPDENVLDSALKTVKICLGGWSIAYALGNSILSEAFGETYKKYKDEIDAAYSFVTTLGFGLVVNYLADYSPEKVVGASFLRALASVPLGPLTTRFTNSLRHVRDEIGMTDTTTRFQNESWRNNVVPLTVMLAVPLAVAAGSIISTPPAFKGAFNYLVLYGPLLVP